MDENFIKMMIGENATNMDQSFNANKENKHQNMVVNVASIDNITPDTPREYPITLKYRNLEKLGCGAFGIVFKAEILSCDDEHDYDKKFISNVCAIKKIHKIENIDNEREIFILRQLKHENIIKCFYCFPSNSSSSSSDSKVKFVNIVMEYMPSNLVNYIRWTKNNQETIPELTIVATIFQILNALCYIHELGLCHRDIKPHNILFDIDNLHVKICDFGSAKFLSNNSSNENSTYIGARMYRAPELLFNNPKYSFGIDIWAAGCILGELMLLDPLFSGSSSLEVMQSIIQVLGTPPVSYLNDICSDFDFSVFPTIEPTINDLIIKYKIFVRGLLKRMLIFSPEIRPSTREILGSREFMDFFVNGAIINRHSIVASTFLDLTVVSRDMCLTNGNNGC